MPIYIDLWKILNVCDNLEINKKRFLIFFEIICYALFTLLKEFFSYFIFIKFISNLFKCYNDFF